jgi:hypothetical protein
VTGRNKLTLMLRAVKTQPTSMHNLAGERRFGIVDALAARCAS